MKEFRRMRMMSVSAAFLLLLSATACAVPNTQAFPATQTIQYGKVDAIDGSQITFTVGTIDVSHQTPAPSPDSKGSANSDPQENGNSWMTFVAGAQTIAIDITDPSILKKQDRGGPRPNGNKDAAPVPSASTEPAPRFDPTMQDSEQDLARETAASLSDIVVGSVLRITYRDNAIVSIVIMSL